MLTFTTDDLTYHYTSAGSGPPLILLHGFTGSAATWKAHIALLSASRRTCCIDLPGHGQTPAPSAERVAFPLVVRDLAAVIAATAGEAVDVLGYSMGGRLALAFALEAPEQVRRLILESASPGLPTDSERSARREADDALAARIIAHGVAAFVAEWEALPLFASHARLPAAVQAEQRSLRLANDAHGLARSLRGLSAGAQPSYWERLHALRCPTWLITGALDERYTGIAARMAASAPRARCIAITGAGHTPHLEQPAAFRQAVLAALNAAP
jgi:2-succinyl-6-hydroxy-2,4-cyclohexadiene-1-carboxylate synthase